MTLSVDLETTQCIWDKAPHNGFTDLVYFDKTWFCAFREGSTHMSLDGRVRILRSNDGNHWFSWATLDWQGGDVRDPKFAISSRNQLLISVGVRLAVPTTLVDKLLSASWILDWEVDKASLQGPFICENNKSVWRWAPIFHGKNFYSVGYAGRDFNGCLYQSKDGKQWDRFIEDFFPQSDCFANEASLVFTKKDAAYCLLRRDGQQCNALLGHANHPYKDWRWLDLGVQLGGPKMIQLESGELIAAVRVIDETQAKTRLYQVKPNGSLVLLSELLSSGDTSYAGMVEFNNQVWISYYSSHEGKASIYLTKANLSV